MAPPTSEAALYSRLYFRKVHVRGFAWIFLPETRARGTFRLRYHYLDRRSSRCEAELTAPTKILFVCLGNICRSPLAEAAFRTATTKAGLAAEADSAGTGHWHIGKPPDPRAQAVARRHGLDITGLRARQVNVDDFRRFDRIFALDPDNLDDLRALAPADSTAEIALLLDLVPGRAGQGVHDPYYGDAAGFDATWRDVEAAATALVARLKAR